MASNPTIETTSSLYSRNDSWGRKRRRRWIASENDVVCVMGIAILNLVTEVLKQCNQTPYSINSSPYIYVPFLFRSLVLDFFNLVLNCYHTLIFMQLSLWFD
jgi:hypothetical protein